VPVEYKIEGEHLVLKIPLGTQTCPLCKVEYPKIILGTLPQVDVREHGLPPLGGFIGVPSRSEQGRWGWVTSPVSGCRYLVCGRCYAPVSTLEDERQVSLSRAHEDLQARILDVETNP